MLNDHRDLEQILQYYDPSVLSYNEWLQIGMALHECGLPCSVWTDFSRRDPSRFHENECEEKWSGFGRSSDTPVGSGTIIAIGKEHGFRTTLYEDRPIDWDEPLGDIGISDDYYPDPFDPAWLEEEEIAPMPTNTGEDDPDQLITYLRTLFDVNDYVGYACESTLNEDKFIPANKGVYNRKAGELIASLQKYKLHTEEKKQKGEAIDPKNDSPIRFALSTEYNYSAGAWIRFNPLDGKGVKNENVTKFRYALVECDNQTIEMQNALIRKLRLPVIMLVHSGGKSLHAIVRIDAPNFDEYRKRVDKLYSICQEKGLALDQQNRNPSRLSRMPGVWRNGQMQRIIDFDASDFCKSYEEWLDYIEGLDDHLPDMEPLNVALGDMPPLAPELIKGVLRKGHKMLLSGPSKAGKSFAMIELCVAIAEGLPWFGFDCAKGRVLYANLELDRPSCLHRFDDVYTSMADIYDGLSGRPNAGNIDIWNLRGKTEPMDQLAPKLIRRAKDKHYDAVIIDPLYKVSIGDENSASDIAKLCREFDRVASDLECSVIYCHHHSKGYQAQKNAMDRASGSGVFARDPDAQLDLIQLEVDEDHYSALRQRIAVQVSQEFLRELAGVIMSDSAFLDENGQPSETKAREIVSAQLPDELDVIDDEIDARVNGFRSATAWRLEGDLREFEDFGPKTLWFDYPVHNEDPLLADCRAKTGNEEARKKGWAKIKENSKKVSEKIAAELEEAIGLAAAGDPPTFKELFNFYNSNDKEQVTDSALRKRLSTNGWQICKKDGKIRRTNE